MPPGTFADRTVVPLAAEALIFRGVASDRPFVDAYNKFLDDPENPIAIEPPADHYIRKLNDLWNTIAEHGRSGPSKTSSSARCWTSGPKSCP